MGNFISHSFGLQKKAEDVWEITKGFRFLLERVRITNPDATSQDIIDDIIE